MTQFFSIESLTHSHFFKINIPFIKKKLNCFCSRPSEKAAVTAAITTDSTHTHVHIFHDRNGNEETSEIFTIISAEKKEYFFIQFNYSQKKVKGLLSRAQLLNSS